MKKFARSLSVVLASVLVFTLAACNTDTETEGTTDVEVESTTTEEEETEETTTEEEEEEEPAGETSGEIHVYSRDDSSGTRGAFQDIVGFGEDDSPLLDAASIQDNNGALATATGQDTQGIGYVSLTTDFDANNIKPLAYEGVVPSEETVLDGSYTLARPFSFVTRADGDFADDTTQAVAAAFVDFMLNSTEGLAAVASEGGIVDVASGTAWAELSENHEVLGEDLSGVTLRTAGSTSVESTLQAALDAFQGLHGVEYTMAHTGSGDGFRRVLGEEKDGANGADLGFASRAFNDDETVEDGLESGVYALDAVVVVVEAGNTLENLSNDQVFDIFTGAATNWEDLAA